MWHKTKTAKDRNNNKEPRQNARNGIALAQGKTPKEFASDLESTEGKKWL